jgi:protocatechuate 3,4-dioxygenase beta subunit
MKHMIFLLLAFPLLSACAQSQPKAEENKTVRSVGGPCEGCEAALEYGDAKLSWQTSLPDVNNEGPKLEVSGTIYQPDGKTPASGVIMYVYHTNQEGIYPRKGDETGWGRRHGYIRGWIRTGADGKYKFKTLRPGAYPGRDNPEHIHATIVEKGLTPYYIDDFLFDDDTILTAEHRQRQGNRGGDGIMKLTKRADGTLIGQRNIILGENIPDHD